MWYISGIQALNLPCNLLTFGDWHQSGIQWHNLRMYNTDGSIFSDFGIEQNSSVPDNPGTYYAANHIRALLDLLAQGNFSTAQGMRKDYICNDIYTEVIFHKVALLRNFQHWTDIDSFMGSEYFAKWLRFKEKTGL
jgi:hypothetical protein